MVVTVKGPKHLLQEMRVEIIVVLLFSCLFYYLNNHVYSFRIDFPESAIGIFGLAITFFVIFRSNKVYDRWWEARIIWGQIVNDSRSWAAQVLTLVNSQNTAQGLDQQNLKEVQRRLVFRHLAWINSLRMGLRKEDEYNLLSEFLAPEELADLMSYSNKTTKLGLTQAQEIDGFFKEGVEQGRYKLQMLELIQSMYDQQGKCERIKNTPFPKHYTVLTDLAVWGYALAICVYVIGEFGFQIKTDFNWLTIPLASTIAIIVIGLEHLAKFHEDPFDRKIHDTPMTTLCRTIEIDLKELLGETVIPEIIEPEDGVLN